MSLGWIILGWIVCAALVAWGWSRSRRVPPALPPAPAVPPPLVPVPRVQALAWLRTDEAPAFTVGQFKQRVSQIPAGADNWGIEVPDGLTLAVVTQRQRASDGGLFYTVRGYIHLDTLTWEPVP